MTTHTYWCHECKAWQPAEYLPDFDDWACDECGEAILCDECGGNWNDRHACP